MAGAALLVNCTSLGMAGQPPLDLALDPLPRTAVVADLVYVPAGDGRCWRPRGRAATPWSMGSACCCTRPCPASSHWGGVVPRVDAELRRVVLAEPPA